MATIEWRSWPINWRHCGSQFGVESAPIPGRSGHQRSAIVSHDRESCLVIVVRWRSRAPEYSTYREGERKIGENCGHLMEIARPIVIARLMMIERAIFVDVSAGEPSDAS